MTPSIGSKTVFGKDGLERLVSLLRSQGFRVVAPRHDGVAVVYDEIETTADLATGWTDSAEGGTVRYSQTAGSANFATSMGVQGWKRHLYPPRQLLFSAEKAGSGFRVHEPKRKEAPMAFLGVRACEMKAILIQDSVFGQSGFSEPGYLMRRRAALIIAVECSRAVSTCFCESANGGPVVEAGFDLKLNELADDLYLAQAGSEEGLVLLAHLSLRDPTPAELGEAAGQPEVAKAAQTRRLEPEAKELLARNLESPRWREVAERCLTCGNCTMVCPTCFCTTVEDVTDLSGSHAERWRSWDSCFTIDYAHIAGGSLRQEASARYRQWITHKLSTWHDQFGSSGCVGCGRCIAWCPVGIDITEEVAAIKTSEEATLK